MTLYGGTINDIVYNTQGDLTDSQAETRIDIIFTADSATAVLAWGGHIASRLDWGFDGLTPRSASGISGSPYHMRQISWTIGNLGNQDRSLQAGAVIPPGNLTIIKQIEPPDSTLWDFSVTGPNSYTNSIQDLGDGGQSVLSVAPGTYTITETTSQDYSPSVTCNTGESGSGSVQVDISSTENVVCTFVNTLQPAHLTLVKTITIDNGGVATVADWTLSASGTTPISGTSGSGAVTNAAVYSGTYSLSESGPSGYTPSAWSCIKNAGQPIEGNSIVLAPNDTAVCTINNDDISPSLTLDKVLIKDNGGNAQESDWTLTATGPTPLSGPGAAGSADVVSGSGFSAGTYTLSESEGPEGYSSSAWSCTGTATQNGNEITLALGQTATCTVTNNDIAPTLTLVKTVSNDNGGTKVVSDFPLFINGVSATSGVAYPLMANTLYTATETQDEDYQAFPWGTDCAPDGTITLQLGENKTCTILNDDIAPTLTLVKSVFNDYGGNNLVSDFYLYINDLLVTSGVPNTLNAGSYTASEGPLSGYTPSSWGGDCSAGGAVTLLPGDNKTCTISNSDTPASITLTKVVISDNGGNAGVNDFGLSIGGAPVSSGTTRQVNSNTPITIDEIGLTGYGFVSITGDAKCPAQLGGTVTLNEGESVSCTITNDDEAPTITLVKDVINDNGGLAGENDFGLTIGGTGVNSNQTLTVVANTPYVITEAGKTGYAFVSISGAGCPAELGGTVTPNEGEDIVCTITNDDVSPTVTLNKIVRGGEAGVNDFGLTVGGQGVNSGQTVNVTANTPIGLNEAGLDGYSFDSITGAGCPSTLGGTVTLGEGGSITCTIINTRDIGDISGYKFEDLNGNGDWDDGEPGLAGWTIELWGGQEDLIDSTVTSADPLGEYGFENIPTGEYAVCEVLEDGWTQTYPQGCHFFTLTKEGIQGLDFGNFRLASIGDFIWRDNDGDGLQDPGEPGIVGIGVNLYLDDDGTPGLNTSTDLLVASDITDGTGAYLFENLGPGEYFTDVIESTLPVGYSNTTPDPVGPIILSSGEIYLLADVGYVPPVKEIRIEKSNDKEGGATAGDIVTYSLVISNTGDVAIGDVIVTDVLPGGFIYENGSTSITGAPDVEPGVAGSILTWDIGTVFPKEPVTIIYQAKISSELPAGSYKNYATCEGQIGGIIPQNGPEERVAVYESEPISCNIDDSDVSLGQSFSYGGKLTPQVLGAATELPATGNSTGILIFAIAAGLGGFALKLREKRTKHAKN
ncbi:hypothetical protein A2Y68_02895 [Candidatus Woesebacteria bacterium RBG_13_46_13]|uniref:Gram-positive cocci surface proteins LPxTG domain-containing protein n=1 Tax=Candidatus Woesebacteria bacterium RBG_13_46_13 TaxID=1802479 RepID=A0A1F7X5R3_9BACT|nr:MAG: hypothetical protein A2Y68_02895 [Candidatus Woesebacteria bacterium RBG_13_46_13]